jgi:pimeloyl-ACP methyl ester carboxylesterase
MTFYDPKTASKELVDEVYQIVNERMKTLKVISLARSAIKNNLGDELRQIKLPTLLIWGHNDSITPPFVGREFNKLISNSELHFIDHCGHAPMMELPNEFNVILAQFLQKQETTAAN